MQMAKPKGSNAKSINNKSTKSKKLNTTPSQGSKTKSTNNTLTQKTPVSRKSAHPPDSKPNSKSVNTRTKRSKSSSAKRSQTGGGRTFHCQACEDSFDNQSSLNKHHKATHPPVQCHVCKKLCATLNTLDRHMYKHKSHPYKCKFCKEGFPFKSELDGHLIKHQAEPGYFCEDCDRSFMRYPDLTAHAESHSEEVHTCTEKGCNYKANDRRYLKIHLKMTHAKENDYLYECEICSEWFKFFEQRK